MRKNIDLDEITLTKLKIISAFENLSVKALIEKAVRTYVSEKEILKSKSLTDEEKEDLGLFILMQQSDAEEKMSREELFEILDKK